MDSGKVNHMAEPGGESGRASRARQFWLPQSARLAVSLASSIINRQESFARNALLFSNNFTPYSRSAVVPGLYWERLPLDFFTEGQTPYIADATRPELSRDDSVSNARETSIRNQHEATAPLIRRATTVSPPSAIRARRAPTVISRSKMMLSSLHPIKPATTRAQDSGSDSDATPSASRTAGGWHPLSMIVKTSASDAENSGASMQAIPAREFQQRAFQVQQTSAERETQTFAPRLKLSVSPKPRREVRGGFPSAQTPAPARAETEATPMFMETSPSRDAVAMQARPVAPLRRLNSQTLQSSSTPARQLGSQSVIEKLIEQSVMPAPLQGLELRLITPEEQSNDFNRSAETVETRQQATRAQADNQTEAPAAAPQLNINEVADKVYQTLMRRQQLERERKGLY